MQLPRALALQKNMHNHSHPKGKADPELVAIEAYPNVRSWQHIRKPSNPNPMVDSELVPNNVHSRL